MTINLKVSTKTIGLIMKVIVLKSKPKITTRILPNIGKFYSMSQSRAKLTLRSLYSIIKKTKSSLMMKTGTFMREK